MPNSNDIPVPQARYALLQSHRKNAFLNRYLTAAAVLTFLIVSAFTLFVVKLGLSDDVLYSRRTGETDIPQHWVDRAILYSNINPNESGIEQLVYKESPKVNCLKLVCYYSFPSEKALKNDKFRALYPKNIDPHLCTHINLAFASVVNNSLHLDETQLHFLKSAVDLKNINKNLKILLSVGGAGNGGGFSNMVSNHANRKMFIKSINLFVKNYKLDGIDLDWEFPNRLLSKDKKERMHFTQLLHEIRSEINRQDKHSFLLSVAVAATTLIVENSYDIPYMNEYVDYINLMTYDFHFYTTLTPFTGINAPLYSVPNEIGYFSTLNINYSANYWHVKGMEKAKIIVGLPTFGHSFKLLNENNHGIQAPANGYGSLGSNGFIDFNDVCWFLLKNKVTAVFDIETKSPYASKSTEWISFDDQTSLTFKVEFIKNNNFGGAMILSLNTDDYRGLCKLDGKPIQFPLTNKVKTILNDQQL